MHTFFKVKNFYRNDIYNILASISIIYSLKKTKNLSINTFSKFKTMEGRGDISKISLNNKSLTGIRTDSLLAVQQVGFTTTTLYRVKDIAKTGTEN